MEISLTIFHFDVAFRVSIPVVHKSNLMVQEHIYIYYIQVVSNCSEWSCIAYSVKIHPL